MSKDLHWSKFHWDDYENDLALKSCSLAAQGLWLRLLGIMRRAVPWGHLVVGGKPATTSDIGVLVGMFDEVVVLALIQELEAEGCLLRSSDGWLYSPFLLAARGREISESSRLSGAAWSTIRRTIFNRDGRRCFYCLDECGPFECDHVIPLSRGGNNTSGNLVIACVACNRSKASKLVSEWLT